MPKLIDTIPNFDGWLRRRNALLRQEYGQEWLREFLARERTHSRMTSAAFETRIERLTRIKKRLLEGDELTGAETKFWLEIIDRHFHRHDVAEVFGPNRWPLRAKHVADLRERYRKAGIVGKRGRGRPPGEWARAKAEGRSTYRRDEPCKRHPDSVFLTRNRKCKGCQDEERAEWEASPAYWEWLKKRERARDASR